MRRASGNILFIVAFALVACFIAAAQKYTDKSRALTRLEMLLSDSGTAVIESDATGRIISWRCASKQVFGYTEDEALALEIHDLVSPPAREFHRRKFELRMCDPDSRGHEIRGVPAIRSDGSQILVSGIVLADSAGSVGIFRKLELKEDEN